MITQYVNNEIDEEFWGGWDDLLEDDWEIVE
jgi:hypothetical protein